MLKPRRPSREVIKDWANELSEKLDRPVEKILERGLTANDFSSGHFVEIRYYPDLTIEFRYAFVLIRPETKEACVFSEHMGYREFELEDQMTIEEVSRTYYRYNEPESED